MKLARFVCPKNGEWVQCEDPEHPPSRHIREELAPAGRKPPRCDTHDLPLIRK